MGIPGRIHSSGVVVWSLVLELECDGYEGLSLTPGVIIDYSIFVATSFSNFIPTFSSDVRLVREICLSGKLGMKALQSVRLSASTVL